MSMALAARIVNKLPRNSVEAIAAFAFFGTVFGHVGVPDAEEKLKEFARLCNYEL